MLTFNDYNILLRLNSKIMELKSGRRDLLELVKTLDSAILKTNTNITELKVMSQNSAVKLSQLVSKAQEHIDDLNFMNETAVKLADRLEKNISDARYLTDKLKSAYSQPQGSDIIGNIAPDIKHKEHSNTNTIRSSFTRAKEELISALRFVK